ncbi:MAG: glycoside hydrolase family 15 protein [Solirubrobacterales bacterium]|nr:glycoside hydrolase family 15 protein [Solirubrobacterales bacterium]
MQKDFDDGPGQAPGEAPGEFRPIADYGLLADCNGAALLDRTGSIDWLCFPRFDSPALFSRLLDPAAGHWSIRPAEPFEVERRYLERSLVIETVFRTASGSVRMRDALAFRRGQRGHDVGFDAPHEVLRSVEGVSGAVDLEMELEPRPEYGLVKPLFRRIDGGGRTFGGPSQVVVLAGVPVEVSEARMHAAFSLGEGERAGFSMRWAPLDARDPAACPSTEVAERVEEVAESWRSWEAEHDIYDYCSHREEVRCSSRVLKGLTFRRTGAIVAAPTTSLPETVGGERNWDYRFAWIRDSSLTFEALWVGACPDEAADFVSFMTSAAGGHVHGEPLQIMFGIGGEHDLSERELPHLRGWRDSRPVRVGNGAWTQTQLDVYGEFLIALWLYRERLGELSPEIQHFVADLADSAAEGWTEPDCGMWEMRGQPKHHVSSKVLCWAALDRAVRLAPHLGAEAKPEQWAAERDRIHATILDRGWSEKRQAYAQAFDSDELDASALLMPLVGFLPASEERMRATIETVARELTENGMVLRYRNGEGLNADGFRGQEGTFVICSFWLVSCLAQAGEIERAEELFERLAGHANDLGLLAEQIDAASGELLGNFPQAFSHIGLIKAAWDIDRVREGATEGNGGGGPSAGLA